MASRPSFQSSVASLARQELRQKILRVALDAPEFRASLDEAAAEIREQAKPGATEATVEGAFERVLYGRLHEIGIRFHPEKEGGVELKRHVTRGRTDSRLGGLVIEYKRPALLSSAKEIEKGLNQLREYLIALSEETETPLVGILTNGIVVVEARAVAGAIISEAPPEQLSGEVLRRFTQHFISLALTALTPENLIRDFCGTEGGGALFHTARVLFKILSTGQEPKTTMLRSEWEEMFRLAHDDQSQQQRIEERREALAGLFAVRIGNAETEYRALFALHTSYAILLKLMAYRTVSDIYLGEAETNYGSLATAANKPLREFCSELEDGEVFRHLNIINLLEGDFFAWYCDRKQWTADVAEAIRSMLTILARYEEVGHIFEANDAPDIFRELYQAAVPRVVRSSFGEFYTPHWLAERVLDAAAPKDDWRAIDPCCGSGTFVVSAIARLRSECEAKKLNDHDTVRQILQRVAAIDLNPLGVLTTRINYFIHISNLLTSLQSPIVIPVFLGDAAAIPERASLGPVKCLKFELKTLKKPIVTTLPVSLVENTAEFMQRMLRYELAIKAKNSSAARDLLLNGVPQPERTFLVRQAVTALTERLIELERNGWNGIWARILSNFLTTACLGKFSVVIGNPPWIDWKNLPEGYRERIKNLCIDRGLFSGAGRTGGINLNICALISFVSMTNWLSQAGKLAFLMPRELANQASYEGWRRLDGKWTFSEFHDWSGAGHPFDPVKEDFMTYVITSKKKASLRSVPVTIYKKPRAVRSKATEWSSEAASAALVVSHGVAGQIIPESTAFAFAKDQKELDEFSLIAGECEYVGREGIQFYPQELQLLQYVGAGPREKTVRLKNVQVKKAQHKLPSMTVILETKYLQPLVTAPTIRPFQVDYDGLLVAFPYEANSPNRPIAPEALANTSPLLLRHYKKHRDMIEGLSKFNEKIRGPNPGAFYGLARTGPYSFAKTYVAFRKDTQWCAAVVSSQKVPWGGQKRVVFQSHAVSMCERQDGSFINDDEAQYICAILNTPIVERFIEATSDNRSYKVRPPILVPLYDPDDERHVVLSTLSREAHKASSGIDELRAKMEQVYLSICADEAFDALTANDRLRDIEKEPGQLVEGDELDAALAALLD